MKQPGDHFGIIVVDHMENEGTARSMFGGYPVVLWEENGVKYAEARSSVDGYLYLVKDTRLLPTSGGRTALLSGTVASCVGPSVYNGH